MTMDHAAVHNVRVIATGFGSLYPEHMYGTDDVHPRLIAPRR